MSSNSMYTQRDAQHMQSFSLWFFAAMASFAVMTVLLKKQAIAGALAWGLTAATVLLAVMMIRAYIIFLRGADELLRNVQLEALALSYGATIVFMLGWRLCERLGAPKLDVNDPLIIMVGVFAIAQLIGHRRYTSESEETP